MRKEARKSEIRRWLVAMGLSLCALVGGRAQDAATLLDEAAAAYERSNGLSAKFSIHNFSPAQNVGESFEGTIQMRGEKFVLSTPDVTTWFDGTTQWSYVGRVEEVNVTTPTGDDLRMTNPMILLNDYQKGFSATLKGESTGPNGKSVYDIELTPKTRGSDLKRVELRIEKFKKLPAAIVVELTNGTRTSVQIDAIQTGLNQPDPFFTFPKAEYPDAEIIDLR